MPVAGCVRRMAGGLVDVLSARPAGPHPLDLVVLGPQVDLHVFRLGHDRHGGGGGVDAALGLGLRHALHAVAAALVLQVAEDLAAFDPQDQLLEPAQLRGAHVQDLDLPAFALGVVLVHFIEVAGEEGGLVAPRAGADLDNAPVAVGVLAARCKVQELVPAGFALGLQVGQLRLGQLAKLGIVAVEHLQGLGDLSVEALEAAVLGGHLGQRAVLAVHGRLPGRVGQHGGVQQQPLQFLEAGKGFFQFVAHGAVGRAGRLGLP